MINKKIFFLVALALLYACAPTKVANLRSTNQYAGKKEVQRKEIVMKEGTFLLTNLSLVSGGFHYRHPKINGYITNNTTKDWNEVIFEVEMYDQSDKKLTDEQGRNLTFSIDFIKRSETRSIGWGYGKMLIGVGFPTISRYDIRFKGGEYTAKYIIVMTKPKQSQELTFEDSFISIKFVTPKGKYGPYSCSVGFVLHNKTYNPIRIDWNQVAYVDVLSESHKVMHLGIKFEERYNSQVSTIVPPTAKVEDKIFPSDYAYYEPPLSKYYSGWHRKSLFPEGLEAKKFKGCSFSIFMPLEINGVVKNYLFTFKIMDIII